MLKLADIRQVQIELTTRCNARCPMCMRNYRGLDYNSGYPVTELSLSQIKHILSRDFLAQLSLGVFFNGNLGDFGLARDAQHIVHWLADQNVKVYINTNGSMRTPEWWASLARPGVTVGFALDGIDQPTHALYRQDTDWDTVIKNAKAFIAAGGEAVWRFIPFDHNRHQEEDCKKLAQDLGFARFENIDEGRNRGAVYTRSGEFSHWLGEPYTEHERQNPTPVKQLLEHHVTWFDPLTVKSDNDTLPLQITCQHKRGAIYIAADGSVYPCCFLGFYPATMYQPGNSQLAPLVSENNALEYDLAHCMTWFERVEETWQRKSIADGRLYTCVSTCGQRQPTKHVQTMLSPS